MEIETNMNDNRFLDDLLALVKPNKQALTLLSLDVIDEDLLKEIQNLTDEKRVSIYFGKTLRDIKCVIKEDRFDRDHELIIHYKGPKKLTIVSVSLPYAELQDAEYRTLTQIVQEYRNYINGLFKYMFELDRIDNCCCVVEPLQPTFKDDFRRILLGEGIWLNLEVTLAGLATNIHLIGQTDELQEKLQSGLLSWDHDKDIVENIMTVFDLTEFPFLPNTCDCNSGAGVNSYRKASPACGICLCEELPGNLGLPQPLCEVPTCRVHFHRNCLYQWLLASSENRPSPFGVVAGLCPSCLSPIVCNEKNY